MANSKSKKSVKNDSKNYIFLYALLVLLLSLFIPGFFKINKVLTEKVEDLIEEKIYIPSSPEIEAKEEGWVKENVVYVSKDAASRHGIAYYEYCVREDEDFDKCEWHKSDTKNAIIAETGVYNVVFRAVNNKDKHSKISNIIKVYVDNEAPEINGDDVKLTSYDTKVKVKLNAKDRASGLAKVLYSLDDNEYLPLEDEITNLNPDTEYNLYLKAIDKVGNEKTLRIPFKTVKRGATPVDLNGNPVSGNGEETTNNEDDNLIPEISLEDVPSVITYGDSYQLPTSYKFDQKGGTVTCTVNNQEYTDTKDLPVGALTITCTAKGNNGLETTITKDITVNEQEGADEIKDGWIKLNLYYPENSTAREWRLDNENGIRTGYNSDSWEPYTGPILIRVEDIGNVYIRYKLNNHTVTVVPTGKVLVDIEPERYSLDAGAKTKVKITYDAAAVTKEYRVNGEPWQSYIEPFEVTNDSFIEARAIKNVNVYDNGGNIVGTKVLTGSDTVYISTNDIPVLSAVSSSGSYNSANTISSSLSWIPSGPGGYPQTSSGGRIYSSTYLPGPEISINPTNVVEKTTVTVTPQYSARKIYYRVGIYGTFNEYTGPFDVDTNTIVYAYYIKDDNGVQSDTSYYIISNIKQRNLPYIRINTDPGDYLSNAVNQVNVSITGSDYNGNIEYSFDNIYYQTYTGPISVTESKTIYAKASNDYGTTYESKVIRTITPPTPQEKLDVFINANPDKTQVQGLIGNTIISIDYDKRATDKYYKIGFDSNWIPYTGPFKLESNATIYAYASNTNGYGDALLKVDYLTTGISSPVINADTSNPSPTLLVSIDYDQNAVIKQYRVGPNGDLLDYTEPFYVDENTEIYAYNEDALGHGASSVKIIKNIVTLPNYTLIEKDAYYLIKLNFPDVSDVNSRDYKWKSTGTWKKYDSKGILLIKPNSGLTISPDGVKIIDDNGNEITFADHYYTLDCDISEMAENIFMRWDNAKPNAPEIVLDTTDSTKVVNVMINYDQSLVKRYYKTVDALGNDSGWLEYIRPFTIDTNNVTVYAKGYNRIEIESYVGKKVITNVDENSPEITIRGAFSATDPKKQKVGLTVSATDDVRLDLIKWAKGNKNISYFENNGTFVNNNTQVMVSANGDYTFYAIDAVGNEVIKVVTVENIDLTAPKLSIEDKTISFGIVATVEIDYEDSDTKQYSIGGNENYQNYSGTLTINSGDIYNKANGDGSLTICAKGKDKAGNIAELCEKIYSLDLDMPVAPTINANIGYPVLTIYGVSFNDSLTVSYDSRNDIINYIDTGSGWKVYTGVEHISSGTVKAKSVKKSTGLETPVVSKKVDQPEDAVEYAAYDCDPTSKQNINNKTIYLPVDSSMRNQTIEVVYNKHLYNTLNIVLLDDNNTPIEGSIYCGNGQCGDGPNILKSDITLPSNIDKIQFTGVVGWTNANSYIIDIRVKNDPIISIEEKYAKITDTSFIDGYFEATINYFPTTKTKLYKINDGDWIPYTGKVRLGLNDTIYAKGLDSKGVETGIAEEKITKSLSVTSNVSDNDPDTKDNLNDKSLYLSVDSSVIGEVVKIVYNKHLYNTLNIELLDANNNALEGSIYCGNNQCGDWRDVLIKNVTIPTGTVKMKFTGVVGWSNANSFINDVVVISTYRVKNLTTSGLEINYSEVGEQINIIDSGLYKIEVWGAQGGTTSGYRGGYGGYAVGTINLTAGQKLYAQIGGAGKGATGQGQSLDGGYNGGGSVFGNSGVNHMTASGGGATHIATAKGLLSALGDNRSSVIIVAGGGGGGRTQSNQIAAARWGYGGAGGGFNSSPAYSNYGTTTVAQRNTCIATQEAGYKFGLGESVSANSAGGGGYMGGYSGDSKSTSVCGALGVGSGGSGYINTSVLTDAKMVCFNCTESAEVETYTDSNDCHNGTATAECSKEGDGYIRITYLGPSTNGRSLQSSPKRAAVPKRIVVGNPTITLNTTEFAESKTITITYPEGYTNEYSLDYGASWNTYTEPITITEKTTIIARTKDSEGKVLSTSSYTVSKVGVETPSLDIPEYISSEENTYSEEVSGE